MAVSVDLDVVVRLLAVTAGLGAAAASLVAVLGAIAVRAFAARTWPEPKRWPPVTVLKPLCGDEPMLHAALATICRQDYPELQIVFGVRDEADPALVVARAIQRQFPDRDIGVVVDRRLHGANRKISNLINMLPAARHDVLIFSDSDLHVPPDYVAQVVAALETPEVGLVTTLCVGLPTSPGLVARLGATAITHSFLPGVLLGRCLGRQDCLGTTMALRRATLDRVGGLDGLVDRLADDQVLADNIRHFGLGVGLAGVVTQTAVPEHSWRALLLHELRWARTIRAALPWSFVTSTLQFPLFWAAMCVLLSGGAAWAAMAFVASWTVRALAAWFVDGSLRLRSGGSVAPFGLLPLRDLLSVGQVAASYLGRRVVWRGHVMYVELSADMLPTDMAQPAGATPPAG